MTATPQLSKDRKTLTVRVPMEFRMRGGRKIVIAPNGSDWAPSRARIDNTIVKALARAHRWKQLLEIGRFESIADLAKAEKINDSYVSRILRLTLLSPDITEAILNGRHPEAFQLADLLTPFPNEWGRQRILFKNHSLT